MGTKYPYAAIALLILLTACVSTEQTRIDNVPMYGQPEIKRADHLKKADQDFINKVVSGIGTREEASELWWSQAENYMNQGNLDYAMRRYNQSWLLNPNNYQPYWGFARVQLEKGKVDEALKYLEKAELLIGQSSLKAALWVDMGSAYTVKGAEDHSYFEMANTKFAQSTELDPTYPDAWRSWAYSLYKQGKYSETWDKVTKAESLNARPFPKAFLTSLANKLPRPK
jgi:tetratricopeptide (TPR) repeat protein